MMQSQSGKNERASNPYSKLSQPQMSLSNKIQSSQASQPTPSFSVSSFIQGMMPQFSWKPSVDKTAMVTAAVAATIATADPASAVMGTQDGQRFTTDELAAMTYD